MIFFGILLFFSQCSVPPGQSQCDLGHRMNFGVGRRSCDLWLPNNLKWYSTWQKMKGIIKVHYTPFDISQKVWLEGTNLTLSYNKKIKTKCEGPFKVLENLTPVTYRLELPKKWKMFNKVDVIHILRTSADVTILWHPNQIWKVGLRIPCRSQILRLIEVYL